MAIYKENVKPKNLMSWLLDVEERWAKVSKLDLHKLGRNQWSALMHAKHSKTGDKIDKAKTCITNMLKSADIDYNDLVEDAEDWKGLNKEEQEELTNQWLEKFTPVDTIDDEKYKPEEEGE